MNQTYPSTTTEKSLPTMADILSEAAEEENSVSNASEQFKDSLDASKELSSKAREISSGEAVFDGLDEIALLVEGLATLSALKALAQQFTSSEHPSPVRSSAEALVKTAEQVGQIEEKELKLEDLQPIPKVETKDFSLVASKSLYLLEQKTNLLEGKIEGIDSTEISDSPSRSNPEQISLPKIDEQLNQIQARLNSVQNNLARRNLDRDKSLSPQSIYEKWKKYLEVVASLQPTPELLGREPKISTKRLGKIELNKELDREQISIKKEGQILYQAQYKEGQWEAIEDRLTTEQKQQIQKLPQTHKEVISEYTGRYLANFLHEKAKADTTKSRTKVQWSHREPNNQLSVYQFSIDKSNPEKIIIKGSNENQSRIFAAEISSDGSLEVKHNEIPLKYLKELVEENPLSSTKRKIAKHQNPTLKSKSLQL